MKGTTNMKRFISVILAIALSLSLSSCYRTYKIIENPIIPGADKIEIDISPDQSLSAQAPEEAIIDIAVDTVKSLYKGDGNLLISPVSISLALGLTSGGAKNETFNQFERVLGRGVPMPEMSTFYSNLTERLDESKHVEIEVANSVWARDDFNVYDSFLEFADEYYDAEAYTEPFNDSTVGKINRWVSDNTDGMIKRIIDKIAPETVMYLINAMSFDAEWQREYTDTSDYYKFTNAAGDTETVTGMFSDESRYLEDENTTGFVKNYKGGEYGFAVFLPNEDISINDYVASLTGKKLLSLLENSQNITVETKLPKFSYEYSESLNDTLMAMGLTDAFDSKKSDLTGLGASPDGNLYIGNVLHKTFIEVAEKGTKAAAVTAVEVNCESAPAYMGEVKRVTVNRPFVFAIIENETNIPLFIGTVLTVK